MELVYLWVEKYKNIKSEGFNFSPRFKCEYDEESKELTIEEKKDYVSIFPKNINVTAIVGGNGSGKSSLLSGKGNFYMIFEKDNKYYSRGFNNKKIVAPINISEADIVISDYSLYLDFDFFKINYAKDAFDNNMQNMYDKNLYRKLIDDKFHDFNFNVIKFIEKFYNLIIEYRDVFKLENLFFFNPTKIILNDDIYNSSVNNDKFLYLYELINEVQEKTFSKEKFLTYIYSNLCNQTQLKMTEVNKNILSLESEILGKNNLFKLEDIEDIYKFLESVEKIEYLTQDFQSFQKFYLEHKNAFFRLIEIGYFQINFKDEKDREYNDLSQGERKLFTEFLMIFDALKQSKKKNIFLALDEPDLTLHPQWQKRYVKELIDLLLNFSDIKFHIIITSHSPFILSDIPKDNVIFLEKGKQVYPFDSVQQTFGANIHTLLSHGFFMKDGLMGEFAKDKINDVINFLNGNKSLIRTNDDAQNLINIIGEPVIKKQLQKMLDSKRLSKIDEIDLIKNQMEELSKRLEEIENAKD